MSTISAVIVSYDETPQQLREAVEGLRGQNRPPEEILIVDNGRSGALAALEGYGPEVRTLAPGSNLGYAAGVNFAAASAAGDYLLCLNPDAQAEPHCFERLSSIADSDPAIAIVGAQVLLEGGATRNAGANPLHPTGISPSGGYGEPREQGEPRDVAVVSGACCLIRLEAFRRLGGFLGELFMYYDDVDLAWRARIAGLRVVYCPEAAVEHGYEFSRRGRKWFYLERNRLFSVLANYEARTLLLLAPLLLATELGLLALAGVQGWLAQKLESYRSLFALRALLVEERRRVRGLRRRSDAEVMTLFEDRFDSALMPGPAAALANIACVPYLHVLRGVLARR